MPPQPVTKTFQLGARAHSCLGGNWIISHRGFVVPVVSARLTHRGAACGPQPPVSGLLWGETPASSKCDLFGRGFMDAAGHDLSLLVGRLPLTCTGPGCTRPISPNTLKGWAGRWRCDGTFTATRRR